MQKKSSSFTKIYFCKKVGFSLLYFCKKAGFLHKKQYFYNRSICKNTAFLHKNDAFLQGPFFYATYIYKDVEKIIAYVVVKF